MIRRFRHKGLAKFFTTGSLSGIQPAHAPRIKLILALLNAATDKDSDEVDYEDYH